LIRKGEKIERIIGEMSKIKEPSFAVFEPCYMICVYKHLTLALEAETVLLIFSFRAKSKDAYIGRD
jgi:hypothetical protein